jgi:hypothetical protein
MNAPARPVTERSLLLLELNEFNRELLARAADELSLRNLGRLLAMRETVTESPDPLESGRLEPWVQWVSVHTGRLATEHGLRHLGEVPDLDLPQLWERLAEHSVTSGVWGAMNASRRGTPDCRFFLPDPWTFSEPAHPPELDRVLALPRYMARNYLRFSKLRLARETLRFAVPLLRPALLVRAVAELPRAVWATARHRSAFAPYCVAEYLSALLFLEYRRRFEPRFAILFMNGVAHLQHYYWRGGSLRDNEPMRYGLRYVDLAIGAVLDALGPRDALLVTNGLSQENTEDEAPVVLYRQYDHGELLRRAGLSYLRVEALMTNDAHLFFHDADECRLAREALERATVGEARAFVVESRPEHPDRLFYRNDFTGLADDSTRLSIAGRELRFLDVYKPIVQRTGRHARIGSVFASEPVLPDRIGNHELFDHVLAFFGAGEADRLGAAREAAHG